LGILTIPLRVKHVMDTQEKKKKRKKKVNGAPQVQVAPEKPKTWWEVWEELEEIRRNAYDASVTAPPPLIAFCVPCSERRNRNMAAMDRLYQAGVDFKNGRTWPTATQGVQHVWDIVRQSASANYGLPDCFPVSHIYRPAPADSCPTQGRDSGRRSRIG
jgi:hypothetical protein